MGWDGILTFITVRCRARAHTWGSISYRTSLLAGIIIVILMPKSIEVTGNRAGNETADRPLIN